MFNFNVTIMQYSNRSNNFMVRVSDNGFNISEIFVIQNANYTNEEIIDKAIKMSCSYKLKENL